MPAGLIKDQDNTFGRAGPDSLSEVGEGQVHEFDHDRRQEQPLGSSGLGMHETVDVQPLVARLHRDARTTAFAHPDAPEDGFEADIVFIHIPQFHLGLRIFLLDALHLLGNF